MSEYLLFDDQPAIIIPTDVSDDIAKMKNRLMFELTIVKFFANGINENEAIDAIRTTDGAIRQDQLSTLAGTISSLKRSFDASATV
jgi:hypothetical protein